ncbi:MAG: undecaprenyl-diphosphate phosphatase [Alphaproteobacteria bacterium]|nr:MAG: undecaprenyl-diphosphate phosphatase [Alphaproteobacteria bacterium]
MDYLLHALFEAFPISSSMHLLYFRINLNNIVALHAITGLVTFIYFRNRIFYLIKDLLTNFGFAWKLVLILLPKFVLGFCLRQYNIKLYCITGIFFGLLFFIADFFCKQNRKIETIFCRESICISLFSCLAFLPGSSSLGTYYTAFRFYKINKEEALDLSFILNIIPSLGAFILKYSTVQLNVWQILCCIFIYWMCISLCKKLTNYLYLVGIYRIVVGFLTCINTNIFSSYH